VSILLGGDRNKNGKNDKNDGDAAAAAAAAAVGAGAGAGAGAGTGRGGRNQLWGAVVNVNVVDAFGELALHKAVRGNHVECVEALLARRAVVPAAEAAAAGRGSFLGLGFGLNGGLNGLGGAAKDASSTSLPPLTDLRRANNDGLTAAAMAALMAREVRHRLPYAPPALASTSSSSSSSSSFSSSEITNALVESENGGGEDDGYVLSPNATKVRFSFWFSRSDSVSDYL
jgi:hypothetical protein